VEFQQKILAFVLLTSLSIHLFSSSFVAIDFALHQEEIAKTLCEKKEEPKATCNGRCHLKKQLIVVEPQPEGKKAPEKAPVPQRINITQLVYVMEEAKEDLLFFPEEVHSLFAECISVTSKGYPMEVEYPPTVIG
jgi:hypothetical protein